MHIGCIIQTVQPEKAAMKTTRVGQSSFRGSRLSKAMYLLAERLTLKGYTATYADAPIGLLLS